MNNPVSTPQEMDDNPKREIIFGLVVLAFFFLGFGAWAATARVDAAAIAPGVVVVSSNRQAVQHRDGGTVQRIFAKDGDEVQAGQVLAKLDDNELRANASSLIAQWIELHALAARLKVESKGGRNLPLPDVFADLQEPEASMADEAMDRQREELKARELSVSAQLNVNRQQIKELEASILGLNDRIASIDSQKLLLEDELVGMQDLASKGLAPLSRVRSLERALAELRGNRGSLIASIAQAEERMSKTRSEAIALERGETRDVTRELRETEGRISDLTPRLKGTQAQLDRTEILAPASGIVTNSSVFTEGGVISPGQMVMEIVPQSEPLIVEARLNPQDVDDVTSGMRAEVKFASLQGRNLPIIFGEVTGISADRKMDETTGMPFFGMKVTVSDEELLRIREAGVTDFVLQPGLPADVMVPLRKRTPLQFLTEPLTNSLWRSFREN